MIIEIRTQKNGTIVLTAPDGTVYPFKLEPEKEAAFFEDIGRTVLEVLADPEQPEATVQAGRVTQRGAQLDNAGGAEGHLRGLLDSLLPGLSGIIDKAQDASYTGDDEATG